MVLEDVIEGHRSERRAEPEQIPTSLEQTTQWTPRTEVGAATVMIGREPIGERSKGGHRMGWVQASNDAVPAAERLRDRAHARGRRSRVERRARTKGVRHGTGQREGWQRHRALPAPYDRPCEGLDNRLRPTGDDPQPGEGAVDEHEAARREVERVEVAFDGAP